MKILGSNFFVNKTKVNKVVVKNTSAPLQYNYSNSSLDTISENDSFAADRKINFLERLKNTFNRLFSSCSLKKDSTASLDIENQQQNKETLPCEAKKLTYNYNIMVPGIYFVDSFDFDEKTYSPINPQLSEHSSASYINFDLLTNSSSMAATPLSEFLPSSYDFVIESYKARYGK
ncbi:MAG: hypothetical protein BHW64_01250 [Candidatus Melainabacteria bacterium LEY3_CP_29_8]|nr:MAG: hypothetical protein BHW64_01250 [Candidatus Melainabacteria bacterium LEY3_CP_29_8]